MFSALSFIESERTAKGGAVPCKWCVGKLKRARRWGGVRRGGRRELANAASPAGAGARRCTGNGGRVASRRRRAGREREERSRERGRAGATRPARRTTRRR